jgi:hypothetical protein
LLDFIAVAKQFRRHDAQHGYKISKGLKFLAAVDCGPLADLLAERQVVHIAYDVYPHAGLQGALFNRGVVTDIRFSLDDLFKELVAVGVVESSLANTRLGATTERKSVQTVSEQERIAKIMKCQIRSVSVRMTLPATQCLG